MGAGRVHRGERRGDGGWPPEVLRTEEAALSQPPLRPLCATEYHAVVEVTFQEVSQRSAFTGCGYDRARA